MMTLRDLARYEGYELIIDDNAADHPDAKGLPQRDELCAQACSGNVIRMRSGLRERDAFYAVAHEIAEDRCDFSGHTQLLWREQTAIQARWCARLMAEQERIAHELEDAQELLRETASALARGVLQREGLTTAGPQAE